MAKTKGRNKHFGLIGKNIGYSFSRNYFSEKFEREGLSGFRYENFDLPDLSEVNALLQRPDLGGLNVTIPYKQEIIPYLDAVDETAASIGAVNTIRLVEGKTMGFNTDCIGFRRSLEPLLVAGDRRALILGTGGASKAIAFVLEELGIGTRFVSRSPVAGQLSYEDLDTQTMESHQLIINCTPLGTYPDIEAKPKLPYQALSKMHLLYDLIYNPERTAFLQHGQGYGARIKNGLEMLELQAEAAWEIWNR
ncbi:shikimate dehydrogenase [Flagellimonas sp. DF-77]|uniref:shikimate dehydrogenase family protein n=1 Tax=Flagellimonas algarum TaxID=3230298 RepID=UPI00339A3F04